MYKLLFLLLALVTLLLVLPINVCVNAQLPFLPSGNLRHLPIVQPATNLTNSTAQSSNSTSVVGSHFLIPATKAQTNMTALGQEIMLFNSTAMTNLENDMNTGQMTPDDLKNRQAVCSYLNATTVGTAMLLGCRGNAGH